MKLKKIVSLALAGILAVSMLTACGDNNGNDNKGEGEGETSNATSYSTELRAAMNGDAMRKVTATANTKLDDALESAVDKYFTIADFTSGILKTDEVADMKKSMVGQDLINAMDAKGNIGQDLVDTNTKTTVAVKLYAVDASVSDAYALEMVADKIEGSIATLPDKSNENGGSKYDYKYTVSASIVTKPVTSSLIQGVTTGVKYVAVAVTQNVTEIV